MKEIKELSVYFLFSSFFTFERLANHNEANNPKSAINGKW